MELFQNGLNVIVLPDSFKSSWRLKELSRAVEFCTFCKRSIKNLGRPYSNELQLSNLEVIKAWTCENVGAYYMPNHYVRLILLQKKCFLASIFW